MTVDANGYHRYRFESKLHNGTVETGIGKSRKPVKVGMSWPLKCWRSGKVLGTTTITHLSWAGWT